VLLRQSLPYCTFSACLYLWLSVSPYVSLYNYISLPVCISLCLYVCLSVCTYLSLCPSLRLSVILQFFTVRLSACLVCTTLCLSVTPLHYFFGIVMVMEEL
jgi:hypothetical protein